MNTGQTGVIQQFGEDRRDLNVEPVWIQGVTGCNVIVGVVDDGKYGTVSPIAHKSNLDSAYMAGECTTCSCIVAQRQWRDGNCNCVEVTNCLSLGVRS